jgi:formate dehydrogenase
MSSAPIRFRPRPTPKGRQVDDAARIAVVDACAGLEPRPDLLIEHLHRLNDRFRALRRGHLAALAEHLKLAQAEVYEVATFYHHFDVVDDDAAVPQVTVRVCSSLSCALAGSQALHAALRERAAGGVRVVEAPCIGRCQEAPAACVGQHEMGHASVERVEAAVAARDTAPRALPHAIRYAAYRDGGGYALYAGCMRGARTPADVIGEIEASGLRGLGGAGFPAARKWKSVAAEPAPRHMVVNIDEGEVGTVKDGELLRADPHRMLEGMLVAAWAVGVERIWVYLRDEYHSARVLLEEELRALQADPPAPLPHVELRRGAGAYICGEESALIESVEGRRGWPRLRPPIVAQVGVFGRPTLAHNLETLWWVRDIVEKGGKWFASHGRHGRSGLRRFSVSGRVARPGAYLAPAGITLRELVDEFAGGMASGEALYAFLPGGASGGILPASLADVPLDFDTLAGHGAFVGSMAVIVLGTRDRARDAAVSLMRFFEHESCGQCTPCREGTSQALRLMQLPRWDAALMAELSAVMRDASICGLGQAAPNPMDSVIRFFSHEVQA